MIETDDVVAIRGEDPDSKWTVQAVGIELGTHKQRWARLVQVDPHGFPRFRRVECDLLTVLEPVAHKDAQ